MTEYTPIQWRLLIVIMCAMNLGGCNGQALSVTENFFVEVSNACRFVMKLHMLERNLEKELETLSIVWYAPDSILKIPIQNASEKIVRSPMFNDRNMTVITIHGFNDRPESTIPSGISEAYVEKGKYNVMMLDCSKITMGQYSQYMRAAFMTQLIGKALAQFLQELIISSKLLPENIHLIGISLGAQTAGWTGRIFRRATGKKLLRITGLDPAGPCFTYAENGEKLGKEDATFVDIIHVNKGVQGILEAVGHSDVFVNGGGPRQPGCSESNCSHQRAGILYLESLYDGESLLGRKCNSWDEFMESRCNDNDISVMGFNSSMDTRGTFYMRTADKHPYGMGLNGASIPRRNPLFWFLG